MNILILLTELIATATYAILGSMTAIKKRMDIFGTVILGITTATGGGIIRDIILGKTPPTAFVKPVYAAVATVFSLIIVLPSIRNLLLKNSTLYNKVMFVLDTAGLGLFTVSGIGIAFDASVEYNLFLTVFVGVVTGVGGGVIRDIFSGNIPQIFIKHIYACASIVGAIATSCLWEITGKTLAMITGALIIIIIRCLSAHFNWNLPVKLNEDEKNKLSSSPK